MRRPSSVEVILTIALIAVVLGIVFCCWLMWHTFVVLLAAVGIV